METDTIALHNQEQFKRFLEKNIFYKTFKGISSPSYKKTNRKVIEIEKLISDCEEEIRKSKNKTLDLNGIEPIINQDQ